MADRIRSRADASQPRRLGATSPSASRATCARHADARRAAAAVAVRAPAVVPEEVPVLRFQFARVARRRATLPRGALPRRAASPTSKRRCRSSGAARVHSDLHRRRHAEPVLAGRRSTGCSSRHPRAAAARARLRDHARSQSRAPSSASASAPIADGRRHAAVDRRAELRRRASCSALGRVHDARAGARRGRGGAARLRDLQPRPDVRAAGPDAWPSSTPTSTQALAFAPPHLSLYHLTIEPNTFFAKHPAAAARRRPRLDDAGPHRRAHRRRRPRALRGLGLSREPGHRCRHNLNYWQFGDYLGIGAGAHGKLSVPAPGRAPGALSRPGRVHGRALAGSGASRRTTRSRAPSCRSSSCSMRCA